MAGDTWVDTQADDNHGAAVDSKAVNLTDGVDLDAASSTTTGPGRMTVLPRVEHTGDVPQLVRVPRRRFEVGSLLGRGGLGEVVGATDLDIGRQVAIKRIRPDRATEGAFLRFVQEVRTVGRLDHPGIVPIHDVGRSESGDYYFVMKYVDGQTLADVIEALRRGDADAHAAWPFERRVQTFHRLLYAVSHAHDRGVVHRDIKPENVMFGGHGQVQLLDWGVARVRDEPELDAGTDDGPTSSGGSITHTRDGAVIGTPRYMSPEQARGEAVDERADTWALSMLLYEWLTLTHPFADSGDGDTLLERVAEGLVPDPRTLPTHPAQGPVPADLGWYAYDGLRADPVARYASVQAMLDRLDRRAHGDIPVQCPMTLQKSMMHRGQRLIDRHPLAFSIGAAFVMALVVLGLAGIAVLGVAVLQ